MKAVRISISVIGLALGPLVVSPTAVGASSPCPPGQPPARPPGDPPGRPPGRPPLYPPGKCQLRMSASQDGSVSAAGLGYKPGSAVAISLGSDSVGTATADGRGGFYRSFAVPGGTPPGQHPVQASGVGADGEAYEQSAIFEVVLPSAAASPAPGFALRSGAGLAAAPQAGTEQAIGSRPVTSPTAGGSTGAAGGTAPEVFGGAAVSSNRSTGALLPLAGVAGGLTLGAAAAGAVVVKRRRLTKG